MKAALLGVTHPHSLAHLSTLQALPEVDSIVLWDESELALNEVREAQGEKIGYVSTDLNNVLGQDNLFFVIAALRNDKGPDVFIRALEAGKHLMAEKPIGRTAADTARVLEVAERTGTSFGVCYQERYNPCVIQARELVAQGLLGSLISVEVRMLTTQVQFRDPTHWLFNADLSGGGILSWLGCHYIDLIRYVAQDDIVSVIGEVATCSGETIDVEDIASLSLRLKSGAVGSLVAGYTLALSGSGYHNASGYDIYFGLSGRLGRMYWSSSGKSRSLSVETSHPAWSGAPRREFDFELATSSAYGGVCGETFIRDFIRAAQGKADIPAKAYDALQVAQVVDAAYESSRTGRRIMITGFA